MTLDRATVLVKLLAAAYPQSKKMREPETLEIYASLFGPLDYELAAAAVRNIIERSKWWPAWAEIKAAYDEQRQRVARQRAEHELIELKRETWEQSTDVLRQMREYTSSRWGM
jgi:hypothetical protein